MWRKGGKKEKEIIFERRRWKINKKELYINIIMCGNEEGQMEGYLLSI
jgi:hypothetical protein